MAFQEKTLAQKRENTTNAVSVFSPGDGVTAIITSIRVANTSGSTRQVRIFIDDNGTTFDESTALYWDVDIATKTTLAIETFIPMNNSSGNFAYRSSFANALTITLFGAEITNG